jgi:glycosyltransferase involved in cell wall biosynthesis
MPLHVAGGPTCVGPGEGTAGKDWDCAGEDTAWSGRTTLLPSVQPEHVVAKVEDSGLTRRLAYLSGSPRVSTRPEAEATGPRSHVLGVITGFRALGWQVRPYIVGDRVPTEWIRSGSAGQLRRRLLTRLAADVLRVGMGMANASDAVRKVGKVDWVYERLGSFQMMGLPFKVRGIPWILETNAPLFFEAQRDRRSVVLGGLARRMELMAYRQCDVLVSISQELKAIVVKEAQLNPEKVIVLPNGVDTNRFHPGTVTPRRVFSLPTIGFVGNLAVWQGLDTLLHLLAELRKEGIDLALVVVGDGVMRGEWETLARDLAMQDRVQFTGRVGMEEVPGLVSGFDIGFSGQMPLGSGKMYLSPLKLYEYLAMGKPALASAYDDASQVVRPGETGYLFEPRNETSLRMMLRKAYDERDVWPRMGEAARQLVTREHSWDARIRQLVDGVEARLRERRGES